MHQQEVGRICFLANNLRHTSSHRNCGYTSRTNQRVGLATVYHAHQLAEDNAGSSTADESNQTKDDDQDGLIVQECISTHGQTSTGSQHNGYGVHQSILCGVGQTIQAASFFEQVTKHQHTNQSSYGR